MKNSELSVSDYLMFTSGAGRFVLPSTCVQEILYPHAITPLPFVPACIDGLINIEGTIAVQIDFSNMLGQTQYHGQELILINTGRTLCALKVDSVLGRISIQHQNIRPVITEEYTTFHAELDNIKPEFFIGVATQGDTTMLIVDHQRVGQLVQAGAMPQDGEGLLGKVENRDDQEEEMTIPCLIVISGKERYAFELSGIIEIIEAGICTPIPGAPDYLKGFHLVRDQALPVIDLLTLMQQPEFENQKSWVIIIERDNVRYGLLVNAIEGIEHFPLDSYEPIVDSDSNLSGLFVYQEKTTILLSPKRIVDEEKFEILSRHADFHTEKNVQLTEEIERYLQVSICENRYAIPIDHVKRVAPFFPMEQISDTNESIRGAIDIDGSIIPVLALEKALSLQNLVGQGEYVIVSNGAANNNTSSNNQQEWAICVDAAQGLVDIPSSHIKRMPHGNSRFVNGVAHIDETLISLLNFSQLEFSIQENSQ